VGFEVVRLYFKRGCVTLKGGLPLAGRRVNGEE